MYCVSVCLIETHLQFYRLPKVLTNQGQECEKISSEMPGTRFQWEKPGTHTSVFSSFFNQLSVQHTTYVLCLRVDGIIYYEKNMKLEMKCGKT